MHLIATNFYGGPEKQIVEHLKRLDKNSYHAMLASFLEGAPNEILEFADKAGVQTYGIPMSGPTDVKALFKLTELLKNQRVDLLCTHGYKSTIMGWWVRKRLKIPVVSFSRGYTAEDMKVSLYEWIERRVLSRLDGIICVSEGQRRRLESFGIRGRRNWVVHNSISINSTGRAISNDLRKSVFKRLTVPENSIDRKSTRLNSSHTDISRMPSSA